MLNRTEQRIRDEQKKIRVDSYQKAASLGGWAGGGRTLWAISALGAVTGAIIGVVAPLFPVLASASLPALPVFGASAAIFSATGLTMGFAGGLVLGRISGAAAAVGQESEKRMKEWLARQKIGSNPEAEIIADAPKEQPENKSFWEKLRKKYYEYINPKIGITFAAIGAVGGLILGAAFIASGGAAGVVMGAPAVLSALTGLSAATFTPTAAGFSAATVLAYSAGVCGSFGALFGVNYPKLTSEITEFTGNLLGGKIIGREWKLPEQSQSAPAVAHDAELQATAENKNFQQMISQRRRVACEVNEVTTMTR